MTDSCVRIPCSLNKPSDVERCGRLLEPLLQSNGVWIAPTDTIYGISANALSAGATERVKQLKGRNAKAFIMLVGDVETADRYAVCREICNAALLELFVAGNVTLVLSGRTGPLGATVAFRVATDPIHAQLLALHDTPIISTSANHSGEPYCDDPEWIHTLFCSGVELMVDAGKLGNAVSSTIVDVCGRHPTIVREGRCAARVRDAIA